MYKFFANSESTVSAETKVRNLHSCQLVSDVKTPNYMKVVFSLSNFPKDSTSFLMIITS